MSKLLKSGLVFAASLGASVASSAAFAAEPLTHHPIVRGFSCAQAPADVRWINQNNALFLQVHLNGEGDEEGGFYFDVNGIRVGKLAFTAYFTGSDDFDFYWYAEDHNNNYADDPVYPDYYTQVPGHPGFYNVVIPVAQLFPSGAVFSYLGAYIYGDTVATGDFTHWSVSSLPASVDLHVNGGDCSD
ncbi:MAG TPA: hypothetical protein V6C81_17350 [Planktothrix sp.]|jgi:hypothetical protein